MAFLKFSPNSKYHKVGHSCRSEGVTWAHVVRDSFARSARNMLIGRSDVNAGRARLLLTIATEHADRKEWRQRTSRESLSHDQRGTCWLEGVTSAQVAWDSFAQSARNIPIERSDVSASRLRLLHTISTKHADQKEWRQSMSRKSPHDQKEWRQLTLRETPLHDRHETCRSEGMTSAHVARFAPIGRSDVSARGVRLLHMIGNAVRWRFYSKLM